MSCEEYLHVFGIDVVEVNMARRVVQAYLSLLHVLGGAVSKWG
jgi:hypothetical protein